MLKSIMKTVGAGVLYHSGYLDRVTRPTLTVLGYHRVIEEPLESVTTSPTGMVVTRETFARQLAYAARRYRMVSLQEIQAWCDAGRPLPPRSCLVTFDDGWKDNYTIAYPVLRRMGIPAVIFVTTDYMGTQKVFWFTSLMKSLLNGVRTLRQGDGRAAGWPTDVARELDRVASLSQPPPPGRLTPLLEMLKRYPESEIDGMVAALAAFLNGATAESSTEMFFLTWDQLREMEKHGIDIGSHTCTHKILTQITDTEAAEELRRSRETLEAQLGHPVASLAFPNGDYSPAHMTIAWEAGYRLFFISTRVHPGGPVERIFPRPCVHERVGLSLRGGFSPSLFELHLAGVLDRFRGRTAL